MYSRFPTTVAQESILAIGRGSWDALVFFVEGAIVESLRNFEKHWKNEVFMSREAEEDRGKELKSERSAIYNEE